MFAYARNKSDEEWANYAEIIMAEDAHELNRTPPSGEEEDGKMDERGGQGRKPPTSPPKNTARTNNIEKEGKQKRMGKKEIK